MNFAIPPSSVMLSRYLGRRINCTRRSKVEKRAAALLCIQLPPQIFQRVARDFHFYIYIYISPRPLSFNQIDTSYEIIFRAEQMIRNVCSKFRDIARERKKSRKNWHSNRIYFKLATSWLAIDDTCIIYNRFEPGQKKKKKSFI